MLGVNSLDSSLSIYSLDAQGDLRQQRFYPAAKNPKAVAILPSGKFAYVVSKTANTVVGYEIVQSSGHVELHNPQVYEVPAASPFSITIHPSGKYLYIAARAGKIAGYAIDPHNGVLTAVQNSPFAAQNRTRSLLVHTSGKFLYAVNAYANSISAYHVDDASGELIPLAGSPFAAGDPNVPQRSLWPLADVPEGGGGIPYYAALDPQGRFLYVTHWGAGKITGFAVDENTGAITQLPDSPFDTGFNPYVVTVHPSGDYLYAGSWDSNSLWAYKINKQSGSLTLLAKKSFPLNGKSPVSMVFNADGSKAFVANSESSGITTFQVDILSGKLSLLKITQTRPGPWWLTPPVAMTAESFSKRIYTINKQQNKLYVWGIPAANQVKVQLLASKSLPAIDVWAVQSQLGAVYVADAKNNAIYAFRYDAVAQKLIEVKGSPWPLPGKPSALRMDLNSWYVYVVTENPAQLITFGIDPSDGSLISVQQPVALSDSASRSFLLDPAARFAYVLSPQSLSWFSYRQNIGPLLYERIRFGSPLTFNYTVSAAAIDPGGNFLMVSHGVGYQESPQISVYEINPHSGAPAEIPGSPFHVKYPISKMMISVSGTSLYVYDENEAKLYAYHRDAVIGEIAGNYSLPQDLADSRISAVYLQGGFLYAADASAKRLLIYEIDPRTGALNEVARLGLPETADGIMID